jgi:hypothetical protein
MSNSASVRWEVAGRGGANFRWIDSVDEAVKRRKINNSVAMNIYHHPGIRIGISRHGKNTRPKNVFADHSIARAAEEAHNHCYSRDF